MQSKKGQFFIISIVIIAIAMFTLMTYFLTIGESSAIMFEDSSRTELDNIKNMVLANGNCIGNISLCSHFEQIYGGQFKLTCTSLGGQAPYNYTISLKSKDLQVTSNFTQTLNC